ncbi:MAG: TonB-dependent receptor [Thermoanaerobaculia bacterium]
MTRRAIGIGVAVWLSWATFVSAAVEGRVVSGRGTPVEHARVALAGHDAAVFSGPGGGFRFADAEPPVELTVSHPRFATRTVAVTQDGPIEVVLTAKQEYFEEIAVSANRGEENFSPVSVAADVLRPEEAAAPPSRLTELVVELPGVAENGQGGIFQTYSIRGVSRLRVLTLVSGMRIVGERRAGVSASFLDPLLMGSVDVLRGPSSTYYGSGALGGVVQLFPRVFTGPLFEAGYVSQGGEGHQLAAWGDGRWSVGVARRDAANAETPDGARLYSSFSQLSASVGRRWRSGERRYSLEAIASRGDDIAKANTDFPRRITTYPGEEHLLLRFAVRDDDGWSFDAWIHPNSLDTEVLEPGAERNLLANQAFDLGFNAQRQRALGEATQLRYGVDYYGRRDVEAVERAWRFDGGIEVEVLSQRTLDGAEEDEAGLYGAFERNIGQAVLQAGGRLSWQRQANAGAVDREDLAGTAFAGLVAPLGAGFELVVNAGSGLRFPSLGERFFTGVTGRGFVTGNPELDPERSLNLDLGLRWYGDRLYLAGYLFHNEIDDYIERLETAPQELTFRNLTAGTIEGLEAQGVLQIDERTVLSFGGHLLDGKDAAGGRLADIPADRLYLALRHRRTRWAWEGRWEERAAKRDPGSGEKPIPGASLLSAGVRYKIADGVELRLNGRNLLDESYFSSADDKVPLAPGRSVGIGVAWLPPGAGR